MDNSIKLYTEQLLWGKRFLSEFDPQLKALYSDTEFMQLINSIRESAPAKESADTIEEIKRIAKTTLYNEQTVFRFEPLKYIVNTVASRKNAKNSALISVYCAMRIFELSKAKIDSTYVFLLVLARAYILY